MRSCHYGFKPCYKWNTFNTEKLKEFLKKFNKNVLNLVISGIPSILSVSSPFGEHPMDVLNLVLIGFFNIVISRRNKYTKLLIYRFY